ncbi:MAG: hypothetical protein GXX90_04505 [Microbacteriaceae bacterium]|nr:hypothetical protein [Microbacteriaceae bacterium]
MARSNRSRSRRGDQRRRTSKHAAEHVPLDVERLMGGARRVETRRGIQYTVQPIRPERAQKTCICPGCGRDVGIGVAHVAVWRADSIMGDESALADRRHWHAPCWRSA